MGSVVGELRVTLAEAEQRLDQFFRSRPIAAARRGAQPAGADARRAVGAGLDQAALAVARMRERVEALRDAAAPDAAVSEGVFEKLGSSLGRWAF
jgi:hypothetical protein